MLRWTLPGHGTRCASRGCRARVREGVALQRAVWTDLDRDRVVIATGIEARAIVVVLIDVHAQIDLRTAQCDTGRTRQKNGAAMDRLSPTPEMLPLPTLLGVTSTV